MDVQHLAKQHRDTPLRTTMNMMHEPETSWWGQMALVQPKGTFRGSLCICRRPVPIPRISQKLCNCRSGEKHNRAHSTSCTVRDHLELKHSSHRLDTTLASRQLVHHINQSLSRPSALSTSDVKQPFRRTSLLVFELRRTRHCCSSSARRSA